MGLSKEEVIKQKNERIGLKKHNYQGCLMEIVEYKNAKNIVVEFKDDYMTRVNTRWSHFLQSSVKNPYHPSVVGVGITGNKYTTTKGGKPSKEYDTWKHMLQRCFDQECKTIHKTYNDVTCCDDWLLFENFYEWLHSQDNFEKWYNLKRGALDKDILIKGNKIYSPETCCLVPDDVNKLFIKHNYERGNLPIGVSYHEQSKKYTSSHSFGKNEYHRQKTEYYDNYNDAFVSYKRHKENLIKQIAKEEFKQGNITQRCYEAMMNYEVEITD